MGTRGRGPTRQLSLQVDRATPPRQLRRQRSSEERPSPRCHPVEIVATRCIGQPRSGSRRSGASSAGRASAGSDGRNLALSRAEVTQRLRQAWARSSAHLEIYLHHRTPMVSTPSTEIEERENEIKDQKVLQIDAQCARPSSDCSLDSDDDVLPSSPPPTPPAQQTPPASPPPSPPPSADVPVTPCRLSAAERRAHFRNSHKRATQQTPPPAAPPPSPPPVRSFSAVRPGKRKPRKRRSREDWTRSELVTMVSLVSPAESEEEDEHPTVAVKPPSPCPATSPPPQPRLVQPSKPPNPPPPNIVLRRPPLKAVVFKPQNVRRNSVVGGVKGPGLTQQASAAPQLRRQYTTSVGRGILREDAKKLLPDKPEKNLIIEVTLKKAEDKAETPSEPMNETQEETVSEASSATSDRLRFASAKERECWNLFNKIQQKGIPVSFDTVLRGMLTPTEYRLRKSALEEVR